MVEPIKFAGEADVGFVFMIEPGLEEDRVWTTTVLPELKGLAPNDIEIWQ